MSKGEKPWPHNDTRCLLISFSSQLWLNKNLHSKLHCQGSCEPQSQHSRNLSSNGVLRVTFPSQDRDKPMEQTSPYLDPFIQTQVLRKPDPIYLVIYLFNTYLLNITYGCILSRMCSKYWDTAGVKQTISALMDLTFSYFLFLTRKLKKEGSNFANYFFNEYLCK